MGRKNRGKGFLGLNPGLKAAGPILSRREAEYIAQKKDKSVEQVMSKAVDKGIALGSNLVNSYNRGTYESQGPRFREPPVNLSGLSGLRLEKGQTYAGIAPTTVNSVPSYSPVVLPREVVRAYNKERKAGGSPTIPGTEVNQSSNERPVPGQIPAAPGLTEEQAQNIVNLQISADNRGQHMESFKKAFAEAETSARKLRDDKAAAKAARRAERDSASAAEISRRAQDEADFRSRLEKISSDYVAARGNQTNTPEADRQARMIYEFEKARKNIDRNDNYKLGDFKRRFSDFDTPPAAGTEEAPAEGTSEEATPGITYQELLNRLKQYRQGGI